MRWPEGSPLLALNPPYFLFLEFSILVCFQKEEKLFFAPYKRHFCLFLFPNVSLGFSLAFLALPLLSFRPSFLVFFISSFFSSLFFCFYVCRK